ncbi:hypothetical protein JSY36_00885 [Bacillus sp. H-16]|uniref:hypothetical protein n=1 Tax=Alteribacter salitolerans TaxID=2912333 RepID=UPI0019665A42|nr:hypothetical protein [Alteribacter salitolerans]MBM7094295.1 hypothetical protein [Alteribacter salitolerans]
MNFMITCAILLVVLFLLRATQRYSKPSKRAWWKKYVPSLITFTASAVFLVKAHYFSTIYQPIVDMTFFILFGVLSIVSFFIVLISHRFTKEK